MSPSAASERVRLWRPSALPGVECLAAEYRCQTFARHFHEGYALGVIERGALGFRYRGEGVVAPVGCVNLVVPGEPHDGGPAAPEGWGYRMLYLPPELLREAVEGLGLKPAGLPWFTAGVLDDRLLAGEIVALHRDLEYGLPALETEIRLLALLSRWIVRHADNPPLPRAPGKEPRAVRLGREVMDARYAEDLALADLAAAAHLSPFHFARVFQAAKGLPPHAYLTQVRVCRAKELLGSPMRLADVAAETGFADQSHFTRQFKRLTGVTPAQYRKILQER